MSILKDFLRDPTRGFRQGLEISEMFANRARQQRLMELKAQGLDIDRTQAASGKLNAQTAARGQDWKETRAPILDAQKDREFHLGEDTLNFNKEKQASIIPNAEAKARIANRSDLRRAAGIHAGVIGDEDPIDAALSAKLSRMVSTQQAMNARARQTQQTQGDLERTANRNQAKLVNEFSLQANGLGRYAPPQLTPNSLISTELRLNQMNPMTGKSNFSKEGEARVRGVIDKASSGRPAPVPQPQAQSKELTPAQRILQASEAELEAFANGISDPSQLDAETTQALKLRGYEWTE